MKKILFMGMLALCGGFCLAQENSQTDLTALPKIAPQKKAGVAEDDFQKRSEKTQPAQAEKSFEQKLQDSWGWTILSIIAEGEYDSMKKDESVQKALKNSGVENP